MIPDLETYFRRSTPERDAVLLALEDEARRESIPIVGPVVGKLLYILVRAMGATRILELGTATGYSAIYCARALDPGGQLVTFDKDWDMARRARTNFEQAGVADRIEIRVGDAAEGLSSLESRFDLAFLDIDKQDYAGVLPHCHRLLRAEGLLVTDNVGFETAMDFNRTVRESPLWRPVHLLAFLPGHSPETDGLCLALRI